MTRHTYSCPLRWSDIDQLGHVNNVSYIDYLQDARVDMLRIHPEHSGGEELASGTVVVRHEVSFRHQLHYREEPVTIEVWVTDIGAATTTLAYEIFDEAADGSRTVYLQARSVLSPYVFETELPRRLTATERDALEGFLEPQRRLTPRVASADLLGAERHYACKVRYSDVDPYRHVNNVKYFDYLQDARSQLLRGIEADLHTRERVGVLAHIDIDYRRPMFFRDEPYDVASGVIRVGSSSVEFLSEIRDGDSLLSRARTVMVQIGMESGQPWPLSQAQRTALLT